MTGLLVHNAGIEFPGYLSKTENIKFSDVRDGIYGLLDVPPLGLAQIIIFIGVIETVIWDGFNYSGDYGTGYFGQKLEGEKKIEKLNIELTTAAPPWSVSLAPWPMSSSPARTSTTRSRLATGPCKLRAFRKALHAARLWRKQAKKAGLGVLVATGD